MSKKKKTYSAEFKSKVVLELLSGEQTIAQIASIKTGSGIGNLPSSLPCEFFI